MAALAPDQTRYVSIDAVNHVIEAATSTVSNPLAVLLACETIRLVHTWLPKALENPANLRARYELCFAALQAGVAFDNGLLHFTHALEHPLSAVCPQLAHGLGLAVLLPAVILECYPARPGLLAHILQPLAPDLQGVPAEAHEAARAVEAWLAAVGVPQKLEDIGVQETDVPRFCDLVEQTPSLSLLLSVAPVKASRERVARIYTTSLRPLA